MCVLGSEFPIQQIFIAIFGLFRTLGKLLHWPIGHFLKSTALSIHASQHKTQLIGDTLFWLKTCLHVYQKLEILCTFQGVRLFRKCP